MLAFQENEHAYSSDTTPYEYISIIASTTLFDSHSGHSAFDTSGAPTLPFPASNVTMRNDAKSSGFTFSFACVSAIEQWVTSARRPVRAAQAEMMSFQDCWEHS